VGWVSKTWQHSPRLNDVVADKGNIHASLGTVQLLFAINQID
jgi:hypothetical protein